MESDENRFEETIEKIKTTKYVDEEDFQSFLQKVDKVESILQKMRSTDNETANLGMAQADEYLGTRMENITIDETNLKIKKDRCVINKNAFKDEQPTMEMNAFMKSVEEDANRRADDRRQRKEVAERYKNEGNKAFRTGNYNKAVDSFNKAIEEVKDSCLLYTNRALTFLKLGMPQKALNDTEKALDLNESSWKALIYRAQALHELAKDDEAEQAIIKVIDEHPEKKQYILEYTRDWYHEDKSL